MKNLLITAGLITAGIANATCYVKSSSLSELKFPIEQIDKLQQYSVPLKNGQVKCSVTFNAFINGKWYPADADMVGFGTEDSVCAQAIQQGRVTILQEVGGTSFTVKEEMICTDVNIPKTRPVKVGEVVTLSQVTPHPFHKPKKDRNGDEYFWFIEDFQEIGNAKRTNGMLRRINETEWRVVDKW